MGIKKVIAKARGLEHGEILAKLGAEVVYPEKDMAERLANRLIASQVIDVIQLSEKINISKVMLPDRLEGKTVVDIKRQIMERLHFLRPMLMLIIHLMMKSLHAKRQMQKLMVKNILLI